MAKLGKYENPKVKKAWKVSTILVCVFCLIPCLALATFGILHLCGVTNMKDESTHTYHLVFYDEETQQIYDKFDVIRGGKFKYTFKPSKENLKFRGWDINHDSLPDIIPGHIFKDINARAVWAPINPYQPGGNK